MCITFFETFLAECVICFQNVANATINRSNCNFFAQGLDWEKVSRKAIPAPFKPAIADDLDTSNFSEEFTLMPADYSPAPTPAANMPCPFKVMYLEFSLPLIALRKCTCPYNLS